MKPDETTEILTAYIYGELEADEVRALERDLEKSEALRAELESLRATMKALDAWGPIESPSEMVLAAARTRFDGEAIATTRRSWWQRPVLTGLAAGLALFAGLMVLGLDVSAGDGQVSIALGRPSAGVQEADPGATLASMRQAVRQELGFALQALEGRLTESQSEQQQRLFAMAEWIEQARADDLEQIALAMQALASDTAEESRRTRQALGDVAQLVALRGPGGFGDNSFDKERMP